MSTHKTVVRAATLLLLTGFNGPAILADEMPDHVSTKGKIQLPDNFRANMVHMGSWFVPEGEASGFHDVYTEPQTIEHYRKTGRFPDGATLVKELRAASAGDYSTGQNVSYANAQVKQTFVMIKDAQGRFNDSPLWGDGWGWALFKPGNDQTNVATNYKTECLGCHIPAKKTDWIYVEGYPMLSAN